MAYVSHNLLGNFYKDIGEYDPTLSKIFTNMWVTFLAYVGIAGAHPHSLCGYKQKGFKHVQTAYVPRTLRAVVTLRDSSMCNSI